MGVFLLIKVISHVHVVLARYEGIELKKLHIFLYIITLLKFSFKFKYLHQTPNVCAVCIISSYCV